MASIFSRVIAGELPARIVYQDARVVAFHDIAPQAPVHIVIATRLEKGRLEEFDGSDDVCALLRAATKIAASEGLAGGYRIVINQGADGGQTVPHLHAHLLGGRAMGWPPG